MRRFIGSVYGLTGTQRCAIGHTAADSWPTSRAQQPTGPKSRWTRASVNFFMNTFKKLGFIEYNGGNYGQHLRCRSPLHPTSATFVTWCPAGPLIATDLNLS